MSWTESFPVLSDEMVDAYEREVSEGERKEHDEWFAVDRMINRRKAAHIAAFSLFWKHAQQDDGELPPLNRETLMTADGRRLVKRFAPWDHYVQPLLDGARRMSQTRPDVAFRVYLAADLDFLTGEGCEVFLMKSSSLRHNPGAMWRFLALEERGMLVTISDADRAPLLEADIQRSELMSKSGLGFWRVPVWGEMNNKAMNGYRPILACQFGSRKAFPARRLMKALIWHSRNGTIDLACKPPGCGSRPIFGTKWPDYGFDEWFLQAAIYPRAAKYGMLSFIPASARSRLLPLDIEYCTWANPRAEIVYFGSDGACCAPGSGTTGKRPEVHVRGEATVVLRLNGGMHGRVNGGVNGSSDGQGRRFRFARGTGKPIKIAGDLCDRIAFAAGNVKTKWWVDLSHKVRPSAGGAEAFLERRLETCDLAVSGWAFLTVTPEIAAWAASNGADPEYWRPGSPKRFPKLDGPLTLWRSSFSRKLLTEWESMQRLFRIELLVELWRENGMAKVMDFPPKPHGWGRVR